jgi:hypothetical protein
LNYSLIEYQQLIEMQLKLPKFLESEYKYFYFVTYKRNNKLLTDVTLQIEDPYNEYLTTELDDHIKKELNIEDESIVTLIDDNLMNYYLYQFNNPFILDDENLDEYYDAIFILASNKEITKNIVTMPSSLFLDKSAVYQAYIDEIRRTLL